MGAVVIVGSISKATSPKPALTAEATSDLTVRTTDPGRRGR
ncbi:hypothetical protein [Amycolatopsis sp. FBCC-B4732]|nr:hypothetical protein [Amycolatopsis sp. FBCC-B4732]